MLVEKSRSEALDAYRKGRKVRIAFEDSEDNRGFLTVEEMLPEDNYHYLVDVPAYEKPELGHEVAAEEPATEENSTPPP